MAQNQEIPTLDRANVSLTGDNAKLIRQLQAMLQVKHEPVNISLTDVVVVALTKLKTELDATV